MRIDELEYTLEETVSRDVEGSFVVKVTKRGTVVSLNQTASTVWSLLQRYRTAPNIDTEVIAKELCEVYGLNTTDEEQVLCDVHEIVASFVENGLLTAVQSTHTANSEKGG